MPTRVTNARIDGDGGVSAVACGDTHMVRRAAWWRAGGAARCSAATSHTPPACCGVAPTQLVLTRAGKVLSCGEGLYGRLGTPRVSPAVEAFLASAEAAGEDEGKGCVYPRLMQVFPSARSATVAPAAGAGAGAGAGSAGVASGGDDGDGVSTASGTGSEVDEDGPGGVGAATVGAGGACSFVTTRQGHMFVWGYNAYGQVRPRLLAAHVRACVRAGIHSCSPRALLLCECAAGAGAHIKRVHTNVSPRICPRGRAGRQGSVWTGSYGGPLHHWQRSWARQRHGVVPGTASPC